MAEPSYVYRSHAFATERLYRLQADGLEWSTPNRTGFIAYRDIKAIRIFKARFFGASATYWNCVLLPRSGGSIRLGAAQRAGLSVVEDRTSVYLPFIQELETRVTAANPQVRVEKSNHWLQWLEAVAGLLLVWIGRGLRAVGLRRSANIAAWLMRKIGPRLRGQERATAQVSIAFPEKSADEIDQIVSGMWDNLGRIGAEYLHLDRIWDFELDSAKQGLVVLDERTIEQCRHLLDRRGPVLMFGAHIGAWEVSALAARIFVPNVSVIYKSPRIKPIADEIRRLRQSSGAALISANPAATLKVRDALKRGHMVGMLVDELYADGVEVAMFNRPFKVNPLFARFVRIFDCPFHGFYVIRLPDGRLRLNVTNAITPPRDAGGRVDVPATMQTIASTIEGWVREHPEQWLWLHRRWR